MNSFQEEIEEIIGSPEVESLRELKQKRINIRLLLLRMVTIGTDRINSEEGEDCDFNSWADISLRHLDKLADIEPTGATRKEDHSQNNREDPQNWDSHEFRFELVLESIVSATSAEDTDEVNVDSNLDEKREQVNHSTDQSHRVFFELTETVFSLVWSREKDQYHENDPVGSQKPQANEHSEYTPPLVELSELLIGVSVEGRDDSSHSVNVAESQEKRPE